MKRGKDYDWEGFVSRFEGISKINLKAYKRPQMERRINSFMRTNGLTDYSSLLGRLQADKQLFNKFLEHLTINVSEFFRNPSHWKVMENTIIPMLIKQNAQLRIWSAGCSTGEEPYSLAIMVRENNFELYEPILATDLDAESLNRAAEGVYHSRVLRSVPERILKRYFEEDRGFYKVRPEIKKLVRFKQHDLLKDQFPRNNDLILCRNVVIYFTEETKQELYGRFAQSLRTGGILFIGGTEQIFNGRQLGLEPFTTFFYKKC